MGVSTQLEYAPAAQHDAKFRRRCGVTIHTIANHTLLVPTQKLAVECAMCLLLQQDYVCSNAFASFVVLVVLRSQDVLYLPSARCKLEPHDQAPQEAWSVNHRVSKLGLH